MHYYFTAISLIAGICLGFSILYLFIGLRRKDNKPLNLTFALFALCYAATLFNGIRWYSTTNVTEYIAIQRFDSIFVIGAFVSLIWYISYYTSIRPRIFLWVLSAALVIPGLVVIISPATFTGQVAGLSDITLPWGEELANLDATGSIWRDILILARLVTLGYIIFALIRQYWRGERRPAMILGLGMLPFIAGIFYEQLAESGIVPLIPFGEVGFVGIAIAASLQMANSVIKTEETLDEYSQNLEGLVNTRTAELQIANQSLLQEIDERKRTALALQESEERFRKVFEEGPMGMALVAPDYRFLNVNDALADMLGYSKEELIGLTFSEITHPEDLDKDSALARQLFDDKIPRYTIEKRYIKKNKEIVWIKLTASVIHTDAGQPEYGLAMVEDITERRHTQEALNRRVEEMAVLHHVAQTVAHVIDLPTTLQAISETITYLFDGCYTHIIVSNPDNADLMVMMGFEKDGGVVEPTALDITLDDLPPVRQVLNTGQSLVVPDIQSRPLAPAVYKFVSERHLKGIMLTPLLIRGKATGLMTIATDQENRAFTPGEVILAETIAGDIAAAIENAQLLEQAKSTAAAEERTHLARDLHDSVTQTIYSASLIMEALPRLWEHNPAEAQRNLIKVRQLVRGALAEMRTLLFELRPSALESANLGTLLQQLGDVLTGRTRIPVEVTLEGWADISLPVKIAFYRIAQEAFNNIAKHAGATQVWASLHRSPDRIDLSIRDNGHGFEPTTVPSERMGLQIMRERADQINATLQIESASRQGVQITATWINQAGNNDQNGDKA